MAKHTMQRTLTLIGFSFRPHKNDEQMGREADVFHYDFSVEARIRNWPPMKIILFIFFR